MRFKKIVYQNSKIVMFFFAKKFLMSNYNFQFKFKLIFKKLREKIC
jgi:hypothetical protein